ncbi:tRNA (guanosine(46)-N7)-methyltransferase TrmB [Carnobacterium maltaromaticum]|uniref:tRNA (guanosine(46)-N7)-methyltransferase TrmB n=1 Tax=Carnobacterium maltaromaticum TaxID=2751 RepID=UPI00298A1C1C|nr:tRNA (guanosine(46)-N7)-methyltransferase TrmB [Carnobacterium maltaromaticum]MDW5522199.1 tRNA (guanosine(46)-N7)-methyltransferase TrmB [Carnobacterium maltaromaticum]
MRLRNKPGAPAKIASYPQYIVDTPETWKGKWHERFGNQNPIHIEVGTGKGRFVTEMAKLHPEINYIGIELQMSVVVVALDKLIAEDLPNLQLLHVNGGALSQNFEKGEVNQVYLNFSDPWPKTRHEKRRLTSADFIANYESILIPEGEIHFKTDNQGLFEYSLHSFSKYGMILEQVWLNLHESDFEGNVMTEYEEKFSNRGQRIYRVVAKFRKK